mgnify:FL=1
MEKIDFASYAKLSGLKAPASEGNFAIKIDEGRLSDMIKRALALPENEYYGLQIVYEQGLLWKKEMLALADRPDFPK